MQELLKKLAKAKKGGSEPREMHPIERQAKMDAMGELHRMCQELMGNHLHGLKKVSVMAPTEHGLEEGLDKAKDLMEHHDLGAGEMPHLGSPNHMSDDEADLRADESHGDGHQLTEAADEEQDQPESEDDLDAKIAELMEKKKARQAKK